ncbi:MAG: ABC transporter substrate-binding protein [Arcobacteraceae bacterium]|nr:ABC transporter substrate-binding protein [Arcobacteraceae bacterium]
MKNICLIVLLMVSSLYSKETLRPEIEKVSLQLKWKYQFQFAGFIMAKEKGFYKDLGLDVELLEFDEKINTVESLKQGKIDFGVNDSALILDALKGEPIVGMLSILQNSPYALMGLKSSNINSIEDLNNKKLALYKNSNGISINAMLIANNIKYIETPVSFTLDTLVNHTNDLQTVYLSNEPFMAKERGLEVVLFNPKDYGFDGYGDILFTSKKILKERPDIVEKMYEASKKGWEYAFSHIDESVDIIDKKYNTLHKSKKALIYEAQTLKALSGYGENFGELNEDKVKNIAQLFSFMKKGKNNFENLNQFVYKPKNQEEKKKDVLFTNEELEYIKAKKTIKVCTYKDSYPFVVYKDKDITGISVEYLKLIANRSHLEFEIILAKNIQEEIEMFQDGICDVSSIVISKPNLHNFLTPTQPIVSDSIVLVTKITEPYVSDLNQLTTQKIAILKGGQNLIKYVKSLYPNMNLIEVDNFNMDDIENGKFYGRIGASYQMSYLIGTEYVNSLKIISKIGEKKLDGSFGVTNREPILLNIFNKVLTNIPQLEKQNIENGWLYVSVEKQFDYTIFIQVISVALLVILILFISYLKQKKLHKEIIALNSTLEARVKEEVDKNEQQRLLMLHQNRLAQMGEMISMIAHQWRQPLNNIAVMVQTVLLKYQKRTIDDVIMEKFKTDILKQIHYMSNTIDDFKDFYKPNKQKSKFDIKEELLKTVELIEKSYKKENISIETSSIGSFEIDGYPNELSHCFLIILQNAKDALYESNKSEKIIKISSNKSKNNYTIAFENNGSQISQDIMERIFEPYFSTKAEKNGTGIGLYMIKTIIEKHFQGSIEAFNTPNGVKFEIRLQYV